MTYIILAHSAYSTRTAASANYTHLHVMYAAEIVSSGVLSFPERGSGEYSSRGAG